MQDLINKVKVYNELQADTIKFIDELITRANDLGMVLKLEVIKKKIMHDEILLQDAIKQASVIFDKIVE